MIHCEIKTKLGNMIASVNLEGKVTSLMFEDQIKTQLNLSIENNQTINQLRDELDSYFDGKLTSFQTKIDMIGTDFQKKVWRELVKIPYGETKDYSDIAIILGTHPRAIARANALNRLLIIVPCHRVIGKGALLSGYSAGTYRKRALLHIENAFSESKSVS